MHNTESMQKMAKQLYALSAVHISENMLRNVMLFFYDVTKRMLKEKLYFGLKLASIQEPPKKHFCWVFSEVFEYLQLLVQNNVFLAHILGRII